jgi:hypothetical protein
MVMLTAPAVSAVLLGMLVSASMFDAVTNCSSGPSTQWSRVRGVLGDRRAAVAVTAGAGPLG